MMNAFSHDYIPCASCRVCPAHLSARETSECSGTHPADCRYLSEYVPAGACLAPATFPSHRPHPHLSATFLHGSPDTPD